MAFCSSVGPRITPPRRGHAYRRRPDRRKRQAAPGESQTARHERVVEGRVGFFASEPGPKRPYLIAFIDEYRDRFTARVHLYDVK